MIGTTTRPTRADRCVSTLGRASILLALLLLPASPALAQGGIMSTISGVVVDTIGGVLPGADVTITHNATGVTNSIVTNPEGVFSVPGIPLGTYTVTVTLQGFKTFVANDVVITSAAPASVRATLEVGGLEETVEVVSTTEIVQTQSTTVANTVTANQITTLPLTTRNAMDFVTFLPGVTTPGGNRQSTVNGLPQGFINVTIDGVNTQDNALRTSDGFWSIVIPRLDALEEVSVTTAAQGAESAQGAVQIKFVTRSGTNLFTGSVYEYYQRDELNANTWFNIRDNVATPQLTQDQYGIRAGGPIVIPGLFDGRNKAFFFVNVEEQRQPSDVTRQRTVLNTAAQRGIYSYTTSSGAVQRVDLLALTAANGQTSAVDPTTSKLLADIRTAVEGGALTDLDPNLQRFAYNVPVDVVNRYPTVRIDVNLSAAHRFTTAFNYQRFSAYPDTLNNREALFPGFPAEGGQRSTRTGFSSSVRSTLRPNLVNEARVGYSGAPLYFWQELNPGMWNRSPADQAGFQLALGTIGTALTNASAAPQTQARDASNLLIEDTVTWLKGSHNLTMGGSWNRYEHWIDVSNVVPRISFGVVQGDPAQALFTTANFPGAAATNLTAAQNLYALLTGRVASITGDARLDEATGQYVYMGSGVERMGMSEVGFYVQDSWRWKPNVTVNVGVRYDLQSPFYALNNYWSTATLADLCGVSGVGSDGTCNLFQPGVMTGKKPQFVPYTEGTRGYDLDTNNVAPNVGAAWTLGGQSGVLGAVLGGTPGDSVIRGGYSRAFSRNGMWDFSTRITRNPGGRITVSRSPSLGNMGAVPLLLQNSSALAPPPFPSAPVYPMTDLVTEDINLFDQHLQVPYADSYTVGFQRSLGSRTAVEVRYVGTRAREIWANVDYNEVNIVENNFLNEFRQAQANLQTNLAAGRGATFKYFGAGTGTAPLPTILAYFSGVPAADAGDPLRYTSASFANATYLSRLATYNPSPHWLTYDLWSNAGFRANAAAAGIPANFFMLNPDLMGGAVLTQNRDYTSFNGLQVELRRRYTQGLQFQASYAFGSASQSRFWTLRKPLVDVRPTGGLGDLTHSVKGNVVYDLPFGRGRRFGSGVNGTVDRIISGWTVGFVGRVQSGWLVDLGNVRLVGMSTDDVARMFKVRKDASNKVYMLPEDVINETLKAFSVSATSPTGYGTLGPPSGRYFAPANGPDCIEPDVNAGYGSCGVGSLVVPGPMFQQYDISIAKRVEIVGRHNVEFRFEALNLFNNVNFVPVGGIGNQLAAYEVTSLTGTNVARAVQLVFRYNW
jgi:hypothetical protein